METADYPAAAALRREIKLHEEKLSVLKERYLRVADQILEYELRQRGLEDGEHHPSAEGSDRAAATVASVETAAPRPSADSKPRAPLIDRRTTAGRPAGGVTRAAVLRYMREAHSKFPPGNQTTAQVKEGCGFETESGAYQALWKLSTSRLVEKLPLGDWRITASGVEEAENG